MKITAFQSDTGLSQTYYLEIFLSRIGAMIVTVRDNDKKRSTLGQFIGWGNRRPITVRASYSDKMGEVIALFQGGTK